MELLRDFKELSKSDVGLAGGKGASLGEMTQAGIPVPPGFVILSESFEKFIKETELVAEIDAILDSVNHEEIHTVENASEKIKALILGADMPKDIAVSMKSSFKKLGAKFVAVRSSATAEDSSAAAWAGQLDSFLNTTEAKLLENVKRCWASLFTPRAIFYRFEKGLHKQKISVAVVVQKMVESEISGIAFSVHPVTQDRNQLIIEASYGLGEAIVSGQVTPDSYVVEKQPRNIIERMVQAKTRGLYRLPKGENEWKNIPEPKASEQALSDKQISELSELILKIENHYGFPCDIEWAFEKGKFYIVQSRPITTLTKEDVILNRTIFLSKTFSREKPLFYFSLWNDSDRRGWKNFLGYDIKQNLFIIPPPGQKGSVWYEMAEITATDDLAKEKLKTDKALIARIEKTLDSRWEKLLPYLTEKKKIKNATEFASYYEDLAEWWSAMSTVFNVPDMKETVSESIRKKILARRTISEKYTEKMSRIMAAFWRKHFPEYADLAFCVAPLEIAKMWGASKPKLIKELKSRKAGCFMFNGTIYPLKDLDSFLKKNNFELEKADADGITEIKGTPAYKGKVQGRVKKILSFADMKDFKTGEILVTEMTNPEYVPIMKIAAAVVTDEGGATCHAAIASRELQIPCIVGTKFATEILNDGDLVEVDANNGIVRILQGDSKKSDFVEFKKSYSRDTTLFMQGLWAKGLVEQARSKFGWENSYLPFIAHFVNDGVVEIWEHEAAIKWFLDKLLAENKNPEFLKNLLREYRGLLMKLEKLHAKKYLSSREDLKLYADLIYAAAFDMTIFFYTGTDDRSPQKAKISVQARKEGDFFADNDAFVRKTIARLGKISEALAGVVLAEELTAIPSSAVLKKRLKSYLLIDGEEKYLGELDEFSKKNPEYHFVGSELLASDVNEISGQASFKGIVRGTVRIVRKKSDMGKVESGDILVSPMTTPDFLPAMQKAAAFVTDEGGVTCHAAIVAREMKKPCIIGTKIATQVLKDGDMVEVDADRGIVRILGKGNLTINSKIDFKDRKWVVYGASGWPAYITPFAVVPSQKFFGEYGFVNDLVILWHDKIFDWLFDERQLIEFSERILPSLLARQWQYYSDWQKEAKKFAAIHKKLLESDLKNLTDESLRQWAKKYYEGFMAQYVINDFIEPISFYFQGHLKKLLAKAGLTGKDADRWIDFYSAPIKRNYVKECILEYQQARSAADIRRVLQKYHYLNNDYTGSRPLSEIDLKGLDAASHHMTSPQKPSGRISKNAKNLLTVLQMTATIQDVRKKESLMWVSGADRLIREIAQRKDFELSELLFATWDEITRDDINKEALTKRKNECVIYWHADGADIYSDIKAEHIRSDFKKLVLGDFENLKEFKGVSASEGKIQGRAVVVLNVSQFNKVREGDILVSAMTRPEYLPIMRLAGAFITDEGGITSHAAIVAREMKKPCIIGTKIATKVIKDGDLVEVDANTGMVRIIK